MRTRLNLTLPAELVMKVNDLSARKGLSRSAIVEAAISSFLSPDGPDRMEAAFTRRLDRYPGRVKGWNAISVSPLKRWPSSYASG